MPVWVRVEAAGLEEVNLVGIQQQVVMVQMLASQELPPVPPDVSMPPPPVPFLTPTLVLS